MRKKKIRGFKRKIKGVRIGLCDDMSGLTESQKIQRDMFLYNMAAINEQGNRIDPRNIVICRPYSKSIAKT